MAKISKDLVIAASGVVIIIFAGMTTAMLPNYTIGIAVAGGMLTAMGIKGML
jgi:uncharacterized membrane protein YhhN